MTKTTRSELSREQLLRAYRQTRRTTEALVAPLEPEDMVVQTMPDASPTKWHLAHTTWFFETLVLVPGGRSYQVFEPRYHELFNSYYVGLGQPFPREQRGLLSRPTVVDIQAYREHVDRAMEGLLAEARTDLFEQLAPAVEVGLQHEQQHQELLLMDLKSVLALNPMGLAYGGRRDGGQRSIPPLNWVPFEGGLVEVGAGKQGFAYDNERPRHRVYLAPFELAPRPVSCGEYRAFMADGGYQRPELWLSDGWQRVQQEGWRSPLYWQQQEGRWRLMTLGGLREVRPAEPVCHLSYYEADAYARWSGYRLPTEQEWEHAAQQASVPGKFLEDGTYHPAALSMLPQEGTLGQVLGEVWEWTSSAYAPYPGFQAFEGPLREYNGKFMVNQLVLRGGSCVTPRQHARRTYRNFYYPHQRWMFSGLRLAQSL